MKLVYKATGKPVQVGDIVTMRNGEVATIDYVSEPHKPDSEGKVTVRFDVAAGVAQYYVGVIGAEWIEREDRYNGAGHVCPETGRVAMTVAQAYAREDSADRTFYRYNEQAADAGLECWMQIDGIDALMNEEGRPVSYSICLDTGREIEMLGAEVVYMQRTRAERDPRFIIDAQHASGMRVSFRNVPGKSATEAAVHALSTLKTPTDWHTTGTDREVIAS